MRVGASTGLASLNLGTDNASFGYGGTGKKSHGGSFENYGQTFGEGDVIGCIIDWNELALSFTKNGRNLGVAFELPKNIQKQGLFPALTIKNAVVRVSFKRDTMKFLPIDGVVPYSEASPTFLRRKSLGNAPEPVLIRAFFSS